MFPRLLEKHSFDVDVQLLIQFYVRSAVIDVIAFPQFSMSRKPHSEVEFSWVCEGLKAMFVIMCSEVAMVVLTLCLASMFLSTE